MPTLSHITGYPENPTWLGRAVIGPSGATSDVAPVHIKPIAAPTGVTAAEGDIYWDSTQKSLMGHGGSNFVAYNRVLVTANLVAATVDNFIFVADRPYQVVQIEEIHTVAGTDGGAVTLDVRKITAAGTALAGDAAGATVKEFLSSAFNLKSTAATTVTGTLTATAADLLLADGDKIALNFTGTLTGLIGHLTITLRAL